MEPGRVRCSHCGARVSRELIGLHVGWHRAQEGAGTRFFELAADDPSLDQLWRVMAALKSASMETARPEFVAELRARLIAMARKPSHLQVVTPARG